MADILPTIAERFSPGITCRECNQIVGAGQQVRFIGANLGAFHVRLWNDTMTEAGSRVRKVGERQYRSRTG